MRLSFGLTPAADEISERRFGSGARSGSAPVSALQRRSQTGSPVVLRDREHEEDHAANI
jgi:hypothetical protein